MYDHKPAGLHVRWVCYLDVEAALPLGGQRRGVEIELDPVHDLAAVVAAVPLPLLAGGGGGGAAAAHEGEARRPLAGLR